MVKEIKILTLLQLSDKYKIKRDETVSQKLGSIGKFLMKMIIAYGIMTALFLVVFKVLFFNSTVYLFTSVLFLMQVLSIIQSMVTLSRTLYNSKDNMILLTYPVEHIYIYISKLLVAYISELLKSLVFTLPMFLAYATIVPNMFSFSYVLFSIIYSIILPLFPVLIGALLSIPFLYISKAVKKYSILKLLLTFIIVALLILLTVFIIRALGDKPIRIVALFNKFNKSLTKVFTKITKFSLFYNFVGKTMYKEHIFLNNLYLILCLIFIAGLSIAASLPLFFKLASSESESAVQRSHSSLNVANKSTFMAFMRKEFTLSIRNMSDFMSNYVFLFVMPFVLIILTAIYTRINRIELGYSMTYAFIGLITLVLLSASNTISASAISSEGGEFVLLKTAPGKTTNIIWSKLLINYSISLISTTISYIALFLALRKTDTFTGGLELSKLIPIYLFVIIIEFGLILWSIQLDILNPKLKEYENTKDRGEIKSTSTSVIIGLVVSLILSVIVLILYTMFFKGTLNLIFIYIGLILLGAIFIGIRLYFLINYVNAFFDDIEL